MAHERGLPSVPRGLPRELTAYLQALQNVILSMSGLGPGTEKTRAVRVSEKVTSGAVTATLGMRSVSTRHIIDGSVTSAKLADGSVTEKKLGASSVTDWAIAGGAVTDRSLAAGSVSIDKLAENALATSIEGEASGGETVRIGSWYGAPHVALLGFSVPLMDGATLRVGIQNLREEGGVWCFDAVALSDGGEKTEAQTALQGKISWRASGIRRVADAT